MSDAPEPDYKSMNENARRHCEVFKKENARLHAEVERLTKERDEAREWHMTAEMELRSSDPNYTPLLDKYASDIQAYEDRAEAAERALTAAAAIDGSFDDGIEAAMDVAAKLYPEADDLWEALKALKKGTP